MQDAERPFSEAGFQSVGWGCPWRDDRIDNLKIMQMGERIRIWAVGVCMALGPVPVLAQLHVASGETLKVSAANELYLLENLSNSGTIEHLTMNGTAAQTISGTGTIGSLILNKTNGSTADKTVTITTGVGHMHSLTGVLTLTSGTLATNGNLTLKSTSNTATARVAEHSSAGSVSGNVTVERFIDVNARPKQWRTLGLPFSGSMTLSAVTGFAIDYTAGRRSVMYYNEGADDGVYGSGSSGRNAGYISLETNTQAIPAGSGLMAWLYAPQGSADPANGTGSMSGSLTISSTGALNESGSDVTIPVTFSGRSYAGWNLVSNPFASAIDWSHNGIIKTRINDAIYRWNPASASWTSWTGGGTGSPEGANSIIEPGGAFFVRATAASPVLTIPQAAKSTGTSPIVHFGRVPQLDVRGQRAQIPLRLAGVRVSVKGQGNPYPDEVYVDLSRTDATPGFDGALDALSMARTSGAGLSVKDDKGAAYAIQFDRPIVEPGAEKRYYPLRVTSPAVGETTLELWTSDAWNPLNSVSLIDTKAGRTVLLRGGRTSYPFRMDSLASEGRFLLAINHVKVDRSTGLPASDMRLLGNPIPGEVLEMILTHPTAQPRQWSVMDMTGRTVATGRFGPNAMDVQHRLPIGGLRSTGTYVLLVEMDNGERKQLRFVKH